MVLRRRMRSGNDEEMDGIQDAPCEESKATVTVPVWFPTYLSRLLVRNKEAQDFSRPSSFGLNRANDPP